MNKENERVKYLLQNWSHLQLAREYEKLENIIKEVREYIESYNLEYLHETNEHNLADILEELLEILDKVGDEK